MVLPPTWPAENAVPIVAPRAASVAATERLLDLLVSPVSLDAGAGLSPRGGISSSTARDEAVAALAGVALLAVGEALVAGVSFGKVSAPDELTVSACAAMASSNPASGSAFKNSSRSGSGAKSGSGARSGSGTKSGRELNSGRTKASAPLGDSSLRARDERGCASPGGVTRKSSLLMRRFYHAAPGVGTRGKASQRPVPTSGGGGHEGLDTGLGHGDEHVVVDPGELFRDVERRRRVGLAVDGVDDVFVLVGTDEGIHV